MKKHYLISLVAAFIAVTGFNSARAQGLLSATNGGIAFRIYNGYTSAVSVAISPTVNANIVIDGVTNTVAFGTKTLSQLKTSVIALTNGAGLPKLTFDYSTSLGTDVTSNKLLGVTNSIAAGAWGTFQWDSSKTKWQQASLSSFPQYNYGNGEVVPDPLRPAAVPMVFSRVVGYPAGTGTVTAAIYINGAQAWGKVFDSPTYVLGAGNTNVATDVVNINEALGIPIGSSQSVIMRVSRGTTSTDGLIIGVLKSTDQALGISP